MIKHDDVLKWDGNDKSASHSCHFFFNLLFSCIVLHSYQSVQWVCVCVCIFCIVMRETLSISSSFFVVVVVDNIFHVDVHYVCMLVQRFEPHYYYYYIWTVLGQWPKITLRVTSHTHCLWNSVWGHKGPDLTFKLHPFCLSVGSSSEVHEIYCHNYDTSCLTAWLIG